MLVDYKKRCATMTSVDGMTFEIIRYGIKASEMDEISPHHTFYGIPTLYASLSVGGRRPGQAHKVEKHFFNKRIMTDEERIGGRPAVQGGSDASGVGARDGEGGAGGAAEAEATEGGAGRGDKGDKDRQSRVENEEVTS